MQGRSQKYDYNWVLGTPAFEGDTMEDFGGVLFSFYDGLSISSRGRDRSILEIGTQSTSMSSRTGELLFYTNGCEIHGSHGQKIIAGDSMQLDSYIHELFCYRPDGRQLSSSGPHGLIAIPHPEREDRYFVLFTVGDFEDAFLFASALHLWEIAIDSLEPQSSQVIGKQILLSDLRHDMTTLSMVKGTSPGHWWVVMKDRSEQDSSFSVVDFYTSDSFSSVEQVIGPRGDIGARGLFSPDGRHYATVSFDDVVVIYDFDRSTGRLSHPVILDFPRTDQLIKSAAFSASGELLYVWNNRWMYQLDLMRLDEGQAAFTLIDTFDGHVDPFPAAFGPGQLGPDCRLYITSSSGGFSCHVIDYPDRRGVACGFRQHAYRLPHINNVGWVHYPNYRLDEAPTCDSTLFVSVTALPTQGDPSISARLYPSPAYDEVQISISDGRPLPSHITIYDQQGRLLHQLPWPEGRRTHHLAVHDYPPGMYYVRLISAYERYHQSTLKMVVGR